MTDTTNLDGDDDFDPNAAGVGDDQSDDQTDDQGIDTSNDDDDDDSQLNDEDEYEEVERGDKKYRVPKALKPELMMEADYRRKTQALADQVRAAEAEITAFKGAVKEIDETKFELHAVQKRVADIQALTEQDWLAIRQMDARDGTNRYDALQREFLTLPRKAEELKTTLETKENEAVSKQREITAKRVEEGQAILSRDIPGWGPELGAKLVSFVKSEFGIDEQRHGEAFMDPALVKLAHAAYQAKQSERKNSVLKTAEAASKVTPIKPSRGGAAPKAGLHDGLSTEEWMKRDRELQARKMGRPTPART